MKMQGIMLKFVMYELYVEHASQGGARYVLEWLICMVCSVFHYSSYKFQNAQISNCRTFKLQGTH